MIVPSSALHLLPCPVCGGLAELHQADDGSESFVVFCSDSHCAGNQAPACSTAEEAAAAWNKLAVQPYRWHKTSCPCCGWCEADEKGFKEHLATLPKPSRWERLARRINRHLILSDVYWICCIVFLFQAFESFLKLNGITSGFTLLSPYLRTILLFAAPLYFIRIVYAIISKRLLMREFDACLSSSELTTTPPHHHQLRRIIMAEVNQEQMEARSKQFSPALKSILSDGGILVSGQVTQKNKWPAKEGKDPSWNVRLSYFGASSSVSVSPKLYDSIGVGTFQVFAVMQRASGNAIYNTAIE